MRGDRRSVLVAASMLAACTAGDVGEPATGETVTGGLAALVSAEGLAFLAGRLATDRPELSTLSVEVPRQHFETGAGGRVVFGPGHASLPVGPVRLEPEGGALVATVVVPAIDVSVAALYHPALGAPERCYLSFSAAGAQIVGRLVPSVGGLGLEVPAELQLDGGSTSLPRDCADAIQSVRGELSAAIEAALGEAVSGYVSTLGEATAAAVGLHRSVLGGVPLGDTVLRFVLRPAGVRVGDSGLQASWDLAVDADLTASACGPTPGAIEDRVVPPPPPPPPRAPGGSAYRVALAFEAGFLSRALEWASSSGLLCRDGSGSEVLTVAEVGELPGFGGLVTPQAPLRVRLRPPRGVVLSLTPGSGLPLSLSWPDLAIDLYAPVQGAPLALFRITVDATMTAFPVLTDAGGLRLVVGQTTLGDVRVRATLAQEHKEALVEAAPAIVQAALAHRLAGWTLPRFGVPDWPARLVAAEATPTHLLLYLDLE